MLEKILRKRFGIPGKDGNEKFPWLEAGLIQRDPWAQPKSPPAGIPWDIPVGKAFPGIPREQHPWKTWMGGAGISEPPEFHGKSQAEGAEASVGYPGFCRNGIQSMEGKGFLGSGREQEPLEYSSRAWSEVGAGKPSVIPEFLRNFWPWTTNPLDSQPGIPIPILLPLIFPDPFLSQLAIPDFSGVFPCSPLPDPWLFACAFSSMIGALGDPENQPLVVPGF